MTKLLAGGVGSVTAGFGALGALTGGSERAVRNEPGLSAALLIVTAVIVGLGVIAPAVSKSIPDWDWRSASVFSSRSAPSLAS